MWQSGYSLFMRLTASAVLVTFTMLILEPAALAAQTLHKEHQQQQAEAAREQARGLAHTLRELEQALAKIQREDAAGHTELAALRAQLPDLDAQIRADFDAVATHIRSKNLPAVILERHAQALADYQREQQTLWDNLTALDKAKGKDARQQAAGKALGHLKKFHRKQHAPFDPAQLPFSIPKGDIRAPKQTPAELKQVVPADPINLASNTLSPLMLAQADGPQPDDRAETPEVQFTGDIIDLAESLEGHPVKIYSWVRDNIRYIPTYGSIQGAQQTLETRAGNAFDTASLLIALLRVSGIDARYQYGTARIDIKRVMNWVGGVTAPEAAVQLLAQGGIPVTSLTQGGVIKYVRMEHVWVKAWIDMIPSRGARHEQGDTWAALDAGFKQYAFTDGMDLAGAVAFDAEGFADHLVQNADINDSEGWVQNLDHGFIQTELQAYQAQIEQHITQTKPDATVGEVLGTQTIISENRTLLARSLPYPAVEGNSFAFMPDSLQTYFQFNLYADETARVLDNPLFAFERSLPQLAGKRLTFSFTPATEEDRLLIESYLPEVPADGELNPADLPSSLPGYLIRLNAELKLDGEVIHSAGPFTMGADLVTVSRISRLSGGWHEAVNKPVVGEFYAFGIDGQGVSAGQLEAVKNRMEAVKSALETQQVNELSKDGLIGDILHALCIGYFAANDVSLNILTQIGLVISYRQPSFGTFHTNLDPIYNFGIPHTVGISGSFIGDMDGLIQSLQSKDNNVHTTKLVSKQLGFYISSWEHKVVELSFNYNDSLSEGVSAVKALSVASSAGQKIYAISSNNIESILPRLIITDEIRDEIKNSVAQGKIAITSESDINVHTWSGRGYVIFDPETGSGAYRISGGHNGVVALLKGILEFVGQAIAIVALVGCTLLALFCALGLVALILIAIGLIIKFIAEILVVIGLLAIGLFLSSAEDFDCTGYIIGLTFAMLLFGIAFPAVAIILGFSMIVIAIMMALDLLNPHSCEFQSSYIRRKIWLKESHFYG